VFDCGLGWPKVAADAPLWRAAKGLTEAGAPNGLEGFLGG